MSKRIGAVLTLASVAVALVFVGSVAAGSASQTTSPVHPWLQPGVTLGGYSQVVRNDNGVRATFHAEGLAPGTATTMWWVFFNNPSACLYPIPGVSSCSLADVLTNAGPSGASVQYAAGHVIGDSGQATFGSYFSAGATPRCAGFGLPCAGLYNARTAEVHLVLRTHGEAVPGFVDEQISSFNGGCLAGEPNAGQCQNIQMSIQQP
jgi:hypothetical protein